MRHNKSYEMSTYIYFYLPYLPLYIQLLAHNFTILISNSVFLFLLKTIYHHLAPLLQLLKKKWGPKWLVKKGPITAAQTSLHLHSHHHQVAVNR